MTQTQSSQLVRAMNLMMMSEVDALKQILAYIADNRLKATLEAKILHMIVEANEIKTFDVSQRINFGPRTIEESWLAGLEDDGRKDQRHNCIYDDETLGFEKDPGVSTVKMQPQDPLEEIDLGDGYIKRPNYISVNIDPNLRLKVIKLLHEFKDCFA